MSSHTGDLDNFGTDEPPPAVRRFSAGPLTLAIADGAVRNLTWHGVEAIRGLACPVRDSDWGTFSSLLIDESVKQTPLEFEISQVRLVADGALHVTLIFKGRSDGAFSASVEMVAKRNLVTNRAGFCVLHPLRGVVGAPMRIVHPDSSVTPSHFPLLISPGLVANSISGLRHAIDGIDIDIQFRGEVFEMEDQRNWSDASLKTYCRPLSHPRPYGLNEGDVVRQEIGVRLLGAPGTRAPSKRSSQPYTLELVAGADPVPNVAVALDENALPDVGAQNLAHLISPSILQLRMKPDTAHAVCDAARVMASLSPAEIELEVIVPATEDPESAIERVVGQCRKAALPVARVLAVPEKYLQSYQPGGPWPPGPDQDDLWKALRKAFPRSEIGGGVLTYFTELNRCRPRASLYDYIGHGSTAITHAADDCSVIESLEGLSQVYRSARALAGTRDYRLGLVGIGMRSNPYGFAVVENARQNRIAMAGADPRQRGLFAAAWAVGAVAATEGHKVSSLGLSTFVGPFGVIHRRDPWLQPIYQDGEGVVYPLFHVVRFLSAMGGAPRLSPLAMGRDIVGVASRGHSRIRLILANLGTQAAHIRLPHKAEIRSLNAGSFRSAINDPEWLETGSPDRASDIMLDPFAVAFVGMPA